MYSSCGLALNICVEGQADYTYLLNLMLPSFIRLWAKWLNRKNAFCLCHSCASKEEKHLIALYPLSLSCNFLFKLFRSLRPTYHLPIFSLLVVSYSWRIILLAIKFPDTFFLLSLCRLHIFEVYQHKVMLVTERVTFTAICNFSWEFFFSRGFNFFLVCLISGRRIWEHRMW